MPTERIKEIGRTRYPKYYVGDDAFVNQSIFFSVLRKDNIFYYFR